MFFLIREMMARKKDFNYSKQIIWASVLLVVVMAFTASSDVISRSGKYLKEHCTASTSNQIDFETAQ